MTDSDVPNDDNDNTNSQPISQPGEAGPDATVLGTQPTARVIPARHAAGVRGLGSLPGSSLKQGRFGRMFRSLPSRPVSVGALEALADRMVEQAPPQPTDGGWDGSVSTDPRQHDRLPAGFTYLGQFIDHDITFDPASSFERDNDPDALTNFRTPRFDLDSMYGSGPADQPYLYRFPSAPLPHPNVPEVDMRGVYLAEGSLVDDAGSSVAGPDVPRNADGRALIGDPRNDENLIISQLHAVFIAFHNRVAEHVASTTELRGDELFKETQRQVRWHYQWVVINDYLRQIVGDHVVDDILAPVEIVVGSPADDQSPAPTASVTLRPSTRFYHYDHSPFMPVEFSVAAYRFGHSLVRDSYKFNDFVFGQASGPTPIFSESLGQFDNLNGTRPLPPKWGFEWRNFFSIDESNPPQRAFAINAGLAFPLHKLPGTPIGAVASLAARNLIRGLRMGLPAGQDVARAIGLQESDVLTDQELGLDDPELSDTARSELAGNAPLWYYVLKEAEVRRGGQQLGPVGGRIVAEVFVGLLFGDPQSYARVNPHWAPTPPFTSEKGEFGMADLVRFAGKA